MGILKGIVCEEDKEARENNAITFFSDSDHSRARRYDALITSRRVLERHLRFDSRESRSLSSLCPRAYSIELVFTLCRDTAPNLVAAANRY